MVNLLITTEITKRKKSSKLLFLDLHQSLTSRHGKRLFHLCTRILDSVHVVRDVLLVLASLIDVQRKRIVTFTCLSSIPKLDVTRTDLTST